MKYEKQTIEGKITGVEPGNPVKKIPSRVFIAQIGKTPTMLVTWQPLPIEGIELNKQIRVECELRINGKYRNLVLLNVLPNGTDKPEFPVSFPSEGPQPKKELMIACVRASVEAVKIIRESYAMASQDTLAEITASIAQTLFNDLGKDGRTPKG
jgi:hypothetical protein